MYEVLRFKTYAEAFREQSKMKKKYGYFVGIYEVNGHYEIIKPFGLTNI